MILVASNRGCIILKSIKLLLFFFAILGLQNASLSQNIQTQHSPLAQEVRVQFTTDDEAELRSRMSGRIESIFFKDGDTFNKGDILIRFDCAELQASVEQSTARALKQKENFESLKDLFRLGGTSKLEVNVAKAEKLEADANLKLAKLQVERCRVIAPFAGRVARLDVKNFQTVADNTPLLMVTNDNQIVLEMLVPSSILQNISLGQKFDLLVEESHEHYEAEIFRIGGRLDPITQTIKIYGKFLKHHPKLKVGMTGVAKFKV